MKMQSELSVYNTLTHRKERFSPISGNEVKMFVCGQTVYDDAHLGHAKTYINFDIIARWLKHLGYQLKYVQNITDVDDKIIARAESTNADPVELARKYERRFLEDMVAIGVRKDIDSYPRSHDYIDAIRLQIQLLLDNGYAYLSNGDVFFEVSKFKDYTKLSGVKLKELDVHRIEIQEGKKKPYDFVLWKSAKEGEPAWKIEVSHNGKRIELNGRPGWHIEDTAITYSIFGPQYDIHGGANELIFPHHTNEIAQAEAAFGVKPFVKYWLHSGVLNIKGAKMSKSLKNFITIRDALKEHGPESIRLMAASTHYKKAIEYTDNLLGEMDRKVAYFYSAFSIFFNMKESASATHGTEVEDTIKELEEKFTAAMNDDFNTPLAISYLSSAVSRLRKVAESAGSITKEEKKDVSKKLLELAHVIGILEDDSYKKPLNPKAAELIKERERLRKLKEFSKADAIRKKLEDEYGLRIDDTDSGPVWWSAS